MKESKSTLHWFTKLYMASRNLLYTTNLLMYICMLCAQFVAPCGQLPASWKSL